MQYRILIKTDKKKVLFIKFEFIVFIEHKMKHFIETVNQDKNPLNREEYKSSIQTSGNSLTNSIDHIDILANMSRREEITDHATFMSNPILSSQTSQNSLTTTSVNKIRIKSVKKDQKYSNLLLEDERQRRILLRKKKKHDLQKLHAAAQQQIHHKQQFNNKKLNFDDEYKVARCRLTFIFDPNGRLSYWMGKYFFSSLYL